MGNNIEKSRLLNNSQSNDIFKEIFNRYAVSDTKGIKHLTEDGFTKGLFPKIPIFGKYLFYKTSKNFPQVNLYAFISISNEFKNPSLINNMEDQINFYLNIFCQKVDFPTQQEFENLVSAAIQGSGVLANLQMNEFSLDKIVMTFIKTPFQISTKTVNAQKEYIADSSAQNLKFENTFSIPKQQLVSYIINFVMNLCKDLHECVINTLFSRNFSSSLPIALPESSLLDTLLTSPTAIGFSSLWLLSLSCPHYFIPPSNSGNTSNLSKVLEENSWHSIYNSNAQGLSVSGFLSKVLGYPACNMVFFKFSNYLLLLGSDVAWKECGAKRGNFDCFLLQLLPSFKVIQKGKNECIFFNINNRTIKKALAIYGERGLTKLEIDEGLANVTYEGNKYDLDSLEVWGCGGSSKFNDYVEHKAWEKKDTQKHANRKLKMEEWSDSPDKLLLSYGGVEVDHAKRGDF